MKALAISALAVLALMLASTASAVPVPVPLLTTAPFAVLAGDQITDVPTSTITGNVGLSPAAGSFIAGLTCAEVGGTIYEVDATGLPCFTNNPGLLTTAMNDLTAAYVDAAGRVPDTTFVDADNQLGNQNLVPGTYRFPHAATANLVGNLTLTGDADAVWIFQATSDFVTATSSTVTLVGGAQACHVFWQVSSATTLGASSTLVGTVLGHDNIAILNAATVHGRIFGAAQASHAGLVSLIADTITAPTTCVTQAQVNAAAAAAAQAQAEAAAAAQAAANARAAADQAAAAARAANAAAATAAANKAAAQAATAAQAAATAAQAAATAQAVAAQAAVVAEKAAIAKVAAAKAANAARIAKVAATRARVAKVAAQNAAHRQRVARAARAAKLAAIRTARVHAAFTG